MFYSPGTFYLWSIEIIKKMTLCDPNGLRKMVKLLLAMLVMWEAHDANFIKSVIKVLILIGIGFVLAVYGAKANCVNRYACNRDGVIVLKQVEREQLRYIDVHLVTLIQSGTMYVYHLRQSLRFAKGLVLMCCSKTNDNWGLLKAAWRIDQKVISNMKFQFLTS